MKKNLFPYLYILSLIFLSSCNFYTKSLCGDRKKINLGKYLGEDTKYLSAPLINEGYKTLTNLTRAKHTGSYSFELTTSGSDSYFLFENALACSIDGQLIVEFEEATDDGTVIYSLYKLIEVNNKINIYSYFYDKEKLEADDISFVNLGLSEFGSTVLIVDNHKLEDDKLLNYMNIENLSIR